MAYITEVRVGKTYITVGYARANNKDRHVKYIDAPMTVVDFMMHHRCVVKSNGDYYYNHKK